ncbi:histidine phosphatase family protein [Brachybacterium muris]|uniref:histidine phosphatase family protein n=1 Tax=Brachybacterium muris TaxID=219301 RepID=UPI0021A92112|nr:histidine phosphatase family protein [Brachybacterium muris]
MTLFGLVRHGQTEYNRQSLFQGSSDIPLNDVGIEQAHRALDHLPDVDWDVVITSPMKRAEQTGRIIAEDHGIPFGEPVPDLREIDWGQAEGVDVDEAEQRWPGRSFPGREDHQEVADRGYDSLEKLEELYRGKNVLVVAHGTIIRFILSGIAERALDSIPNGTLSLVRLEGTEWSVEMIANEPVENTVRTASREQNPRFVVEKRNLTPGADPAVDADSPSDDARTADDGSIDATDRTEEAR